MKPMRLATWTLLVLGLCVAGCEQAGTDGGTSPRASRPVVAVPSIETVPSDGGAPVTGEVPDEILQAIVADAERQTGVEAIAINVVRGESVTWNDGSLGCPEPGMLYTQALVDGYHVVLDVDGEQLDYRVDSAGGFRICEEPNRPGG